MAIMKPKTTTATVLPSSAAYQKRLEKDIANFKTPFQDYLTKKSQYDAQKSAYSDWATQEATARSNYEKAKDVANRMGYNPALQSYYNTWQNILSKNPGNPGSFTAIAPSAPVGTQIQDNKLSYFDPSKYGLTGVYSALKQVERAGTPSAISKTPRSEFDLTQLYRNASDYATIDLSKLGDMGGVLAAVSGAGTTGKTYIPKSALAALAKDYSAYGLGDINQAITGENAWETMQPSLSKAAKLPSNMVLSTPADEAKKAAADKALADWSAQKAKWTTDVYDPYQAQLNKFNSQLTDQYYQNYPATGPWPSGNLGARDIAGLGHVTYAPTSGSTGIWVRSTDKGYQKLNPISTGNWRDLWRNYNPLPNLGYYEPTFMATPGAAPTFNVAQPEAYIGPSLEHIYAESTPQAVTSTGGTNTSALGQLLRKTHQGNFSGIQGVGAQQALAQQLYGSGGLSAIGRVLQSGTNESLGGISNPMLRGMLSKQLFD